MSQSIEDAERAAELAGVMVREMRGSEEESRITALVHRIWGRGDENPLLPKEILRVLGKTGNYIAGAFVDEGLVGASLGLHSSPERLTLHSHISGVLPGFTGRSIGHALKLHQRAWCLERGIATVEWTYDPLISRNANFNIRKLGALPVEYLENFYGPIADSLNGGDSSDRLLVRWRLCDPVVTTLARGASPPPAPAGDVVVAIPDDIEMMRSSDPEKAREWRFTVRDRLGGLIESGAQIVGFARGIGYILRYNK